MKRSLNNFLDKKRFGNSQGVMNDLKKKWWVVDGDDACKDEVSQLNQNISI